MRTLLLLSSFLLVAACGSKGGSSNTTPEGGGGGGDEEVAEDSGGDMVPPERMDEIKSLLDRKRNAAARCLADAVNAGKVPKNTAGHVAIEFTISTGGTAQGLKVIETSIENEEVQGCVMEKVQQIDFGALPKPIEWSYTYAFESM